MREIKFRAWDKRHKEWCEHFTLDFEKNSESYIDNVYGGSFQHCTENDENVILMQYTGLKDKNGEEIYEGDIVTQTDDIESLKGAVSFSKGMFCIPSSRGLKILGGHDYKERDTEIIGNVYENPELIEVNNEN